MSYTYFTQNNIYIISYTIINLYYSYNSFKYIIIRYIFNSSYIIEYIYIFNTYFCSFTILGRTRNCIYIKRKKKMMKKVRI